MATGFKICKVCGKEYEYCKTASVPGVFRWQDVACCQEHGAKYLADIMASRSPKQVVVETKKSTKRKAKDVVAEDVKASTNE